MSEGVVRRELACRIERLVGVKVESYSRVGGGYTPALRLLCRTAAGGASKSWKVVYVSADRREGREYEIRVAGGAGA